MSGFFNRQNKVVLITGCTGVRGGLGTFLVQAFLKKNDTVVGIARHEPKVKISGLDFFQGDITTDSEEFVQHALDTYGRIDVLINNAAMQEFGELRNKDAETFQRELDVNLVAPLMTANAVLNSFWSVRPRKENEKKHRCVINISSISGIQYCPYPKQGTYAAAKAALNTLTEHMAKEYAEYGIRVNAVAPNVIGHITPYERIFADIYALLLDNTNGETRVIDR